MLPRIRTNLLSGDQAVEIRSVEGTLHVVDLRLVIGLHQDEAKKGVLQSIGSLISTSHSYVDLRNLLWPQEQDGE